MRIPISDEELGLLIDHGYYIDCFTFKSLSRSEYQNEKVRRSVCRNHRVMKFIDFKKEYPVSFFRNEDRCKRIEDTQYWNYWK